MAQNRAISDRKEALRLPAERVNFYQKDSEICKNRQAISALPKKLEMQKEIAKHPAEISLPVILQILLQIKNNLESPGAENSNNAPDQSLAESLEVLESAIVIFGETDRVQRGSLGDKKAYIKKLLDDAKVTGQHPFIELERLVNEVAKIQITENTKDLWAELAIWMEGLYKRTADKIEERDANNEPKKKKNGFYPTVDAEDYAIYLFLSITKMDISIHYHRAAIRIEEKIAKFTPVRKMSQPVSVEHPVKAVPVVAVEPVMSAEAETQPLEGSIEYKMEVMPSATSKKKFTVQLELDESNAEFGQLVCDTIQDMLANPLAMELRQVAHHNEDVRIETLEAKLKIYKFSEMQKMNLSNFKNSAIRVLKKYTDPSTLSIVNPIRLFGRSLPGASYFDKSNFDHADETIKDLNSLPDVRDQILRVIELRDCLQGNNSTHLGPDITELLINLSDRICAHTSMTLQREVTEPNLSKAVLRIK